jgi:hypothetical protein
LLMPVAAAPVRAGRAGVLTRWGATCQGRPARINGSAALYAFEGRLRPHQCFRGLGAPRDFGQLSTSREPSDLFHGYCIARGWPRRG